MAASNTSMMKEYLRKQLRYWVNGFKDDMLPRDFSSKSFSRLQLSLAKVRTCLPCVLHDIAFTSAL